jgi:hypothetical protein
MGERTAFFYGELSPALPLFVPITNTTCTGTLVYPHLQLMSRTEAGNGRY